ncbi:hypothetical protein J4421_06255 [Candidatus Woesearchaeota archaeon]|nr:hypothetical protein [Candidatus Woesearchaeota archaeon]
MISTKKGQLGNAIDFLYIIVVGIVIALIVSVSLYGVVSSRQKAALGEIAEVDRISAAIQHLRGRLYEGENLEKLNLDKEIALSQILKGKIVKGCEDYIDKNDCDIDALDLYNEPTINTYCTWDDKSKICLTQHIVEMKE